MNILLCCVIMVISVTMGGFIVPTDFIHGQSCDPSVHNGKFSFDNETDKFLYCDTNKRIFEIGSCPYGQHFDYEERKCIDEGSIFEDEREKLDYDLKIFAQNMAKNIIELPVEPEAGDALDTLERPYFGDNLMEEDGSSNGISTEAAFSPQNTTFIIPLLPTTTSTKLPYLVYHKKSDDDIEQQQMPKQRQNAHRFSQLSTKLAKASSFELNDSPNNIGTDLRVKKPSIEKGFKTQKRNQLAIKSKGGTGRGRGLMAIINERDEEKMKPKPNEVKEEKPKEGEESVAKEMGIIVEKSEKEGNDTREMEVSEGKFRNINKGKDKEDDSALSTSLREKLDEEESWLPKLKIIDENKEKMKSKKKSPTFDGGWNGLPQIPDRHYYVEKKNQTPTETALNSRKQTGHATADEAKSGHNTLIDIHTRVEDDLQKQHLPIPCDPYDSSSATLPLLENNGRVHFCKPEYGQNPFSPFSCPFSYECRPIQSSNYYHYANRLFHCCPILPPAKMTIKERDAPYNGIVQKMVDYDYGEKQIDGDESTDSDGGVEQLEDHFNGVKNICARGYSPKLHPTKGHLTICNPNWPLTSCPPFSLCQYSNQLFQFICCQPNDIRNAFRQIQHAEGGKGKLQIGILPGQPGCISDRQCHVNFPGAKCVIWICKCPRPFFAFHGKCILNCPRGHYIREGICTPSPLAAGGGSVTSPQSHYGF